ncbi:MAG: dipicolinate synthase subunit DpsA [Oscillospiraceae bacterium]|jgi:dipicolinate synthase subunit A|nr:dipicolinate synthase subunit DpsA [Oscillospiraceae bacterium]
MKFSFIGGDLRIVSLAASLCREGHETACFALEEVCPFECMSSFLTLEGALEGADCVVLPLPALDAQGNINAPLSERVLDPADVVRALPKSAVICAGRPNDYLLQLVGDAGLELTDYYAREELVVMNALITAEGAISIILQHSTLAIWESNVLIIGYGRIGKMLSSRLRSLGANVSVSARKPGDMAYIRAAGCTPLDTRTLGGELKRFDTVINTVPAPVLDAARLSRIDKKALVLDLASRPGGVDFEAANRLELKTIWALGLPAETAPDTAGRIIKETLLNIIREKRGWNKIEQT